MKDFKGTEINIGDEVFFMPHQGITVIGRASEFYKFGEENLFIVNYGDVVKISKKGEDQIEDYKKANPDEVNLDCVGFFVEADNCVVVNAAQHISNKQSIFFPIK